MSASVLGGAAGAIAMIPPGALLTAQGFEVNRYGRLTARLLAVGESPPSLLALHLVIGVVSAAPLSTLWRHRRSPRPSFRLLSGIGYGAAYWLAVNALALPWFFVRPHPWTDGPAGVWPSLMLHVVYGSVAGLIVGAIMAGSRAADVEVSAARDEHSP